MQPGYDQYAARGQRRVMGWVQRPVFDVVRALGEEQERLGIEGHIAEIGVHHGRLFLGLHLARRPGERSAAIDLYDKQTLNVDKSGSGDRATLERNLDRHAGGRDDVEVLAADSTTLDADQVRSLVGGGIRLFSVDGGHTADIVAHDMETASGSLVDGGVVIADDVFNQQWPSVSEGTHRFLVGQHRVVPFAIGFNKTYFTTAGYADGYRLVIEALADRHGWQRKASATHGSAVVIVRTISLRRRARRFDRMVRAKLRLSARQLTGRHTGKQDLKSR
jgi:hypothetical protein